MTKTEVETKKLKPLNLEKLRRDMELIMDEITSHRNGNRSVPLLLIQHKPIEQRRKRQKQVIAKVCRDNRKCAESEQIEQGEQML